MREDLVDAEDLLELVVFAEVVLAHDDAHLRGALGEDAVRRRHHDALRHDGAAAVVLKASPVATQDVHLHGDGKQRFLRGTTTNQAGKDNPPTPQLKSKSPRVLSQTLTQFLFSVKHPKTYKFISNTNITIATI